MEGQEAPEIRGVVAWQNSGPQQLSELRGKVVILDFWGYWCGACVASMPELFSIYDKYHDRGLEVLAVHMDDEVDTVAKLDEKLVRIKKGLWKGRDLPFPIALTVATHSGGKTIDPALVIDYGIDHYPTGVLIDRKGRVVGEFYPGQPSDMLLLDKAIAEE